MSMEAHFIVLQQRGNPKKFSIARGQVIIIGRSEKDCNVVLEDELCSSTHCRLSFEYNQITIEDLDSKNGLFLNGKQISKAKLELQDKIKLGNTTIYLNPKVMESDIRAKNIQTQKGYVGDEEGINIPSTSNYSGSSYDNRTRTMMRKNIDKSKKRLSTKPRSSRVNKLLIFVAQLLDICFSLLFFFIIIMGITRSYPELIPLSEKNTFIRFILLKEMYIYSGAALFATIVFYQIIRKIPGGSLGERILKVQKKFIY